MRSFYTKTTGLVIVGGNAICAVLALVLVLAGRPWFLLLLLLNVAAVLVVLLVLKRFDTLGEPYH